MVRIDFRNLIKDVTSWSILESHIGNLSTENERGEAFEIFSKAFFILDPIYRFKKVYRQAEIPPSLRERLGYPTTGDIGIDGIAVTSDNKLFAYQAKFRKNRKKKPPLKELSTFFTVSDRADWRITIANTNDLPKSINDRVRQSRILADKLDQLDSDFFNRLRVYFEEQIVKPPVRRTPHGTQIEAIEEALDYFRNNQRGQLILPCGTGKTLAAMWIAERLGGNRILVMVPSLSLLSQTLREWAVNTTIKQFRYLCLCSDTSVDLGNDSPIEHIYEMEVPVTTDVNVVSAFLTDDPSIPSILFSTYQSGKVLSEAAIKTGTTFDIGIFDEAHRTTGNMVSLWSIALDDKKVPIHKRLFMTATPRIFAPHISRKAKENDVTLCSMDDVMIYGKPFFEMTFGEAIERDLITDFKIIIICTTDAEVKETIQKSGRIVTEDAEWDAKALAKRIALAKGLNEYGLKKIFTFHGSVRGAKSFTDQASPYGFKKLIKLMPFDNQVQNSIEYFHVNGTMSSGLRSGIMKEFREAKIGIMSNARCLTEGVDVPTVDTVAFIDPKRSIIDIVQATGRALRIVEWKDRGYIFIPVVVDEVSEPEQLIECSDFETVWKVIQAMVDQDQRLESVISKLRVMQGKGETNSQEWKDAMTEFGEKIAFYDLPIKYDKARFINNLYAKILEGVSRSWDFWYGLTLKYKQENDNPNTPQMYKTPEGYRLGLWQSNQRKLLLKGKLLEDRIKRLEEIGFLWDVFEEAFEKGFRETVEYKKQYDNPNAPIKYSTSDGFNLGTWQNAQRGNFKKGILSADRIKRFEEIGFLWKLTDIQPKGQDWDSWYALTLKYKQEKGDPNAPLTYITPEGYKLGSWQSHQRRNHIKGKLLKDRVKKLEDIGFFWKILDEAFEKGFEETLIYKKQFDNSNAPARYCTFSGFRLGNWQSNLRKNYLKGKISKDRIKRLEEIGFLWSILDEAFEKGFEETLEYKKQFDNPNAPARHNTSTGFHLGTWQTTLRANYKKGILAPDKVKRLEEIGFKWKLINVQPKGQDWDSWYELTLKYKQEKGDSNAPIKYSTSDGFNLGTWQNAQRSNYKNGILSLDRIRKLEEIGFKWKRIDVQPKGQDWDSWYALTLKYKQEKDDSNVPSRYETPDGYKLGSWQSGQRKNYLKGKLSQYRVITGCCPNKHKITLAALYKADVKNI